MATLRFASRRELLRYHRSLSPFASEASIAVRDAVEFTRLAAKRWRYYSRSEEAVESFAGLKRAIERDERCETAFIMVASIRQGRREVPVGLAYCRRTWCHHLALDFLALHPCALEQPGRMNGVGSGIVFGLVQLAKALRIPRVWGEATVHSAPFYEKLLAVAPIQDLFIIEAAEMEAISSRQDRTSRTGLVTKPATGLH